MFRALEWVSAKAMTIAGWCYLLITLLICFDIAARRLLGFSSEATTEVTGYLMAIGMSWGLAGTLFERGHVRIDVLVQKMPLKVRVWLHLASLSALVVASGFFAFGAFSLAKDSFDFGATDLSAMHTPLAIPQGLWAGGLMLLLLAGVALAARAVRQLAVGDADGMDRMLMARTYIDEAAETLEAVAEAQQGMQPVASGASGAKTVSSKGAAR
ncbi:TRAP transporter small permease subunit [Variovorax sp. RHLX14]|uniref:TRAP transporter small permease subunit n=1 Tax=Variovorax sp. RHLX14 TaxID=1259731 RepID=UPI003F48E1FF